MAKLLKHLGIGGKKPSPNSPKLEYDCQRVDRARGHQMIEPTVGLLHLPTGNDTDSSSTVSSAATAGSDEFPPPPSAWTLEQTLIDSSGQAFGGARPKEIKGNRQHSRDDVERHKCGGGSSSDTTDSDFAELPKNPSKKPNIFESTNIYENQAMFDTSLQLVDSESLQEVKKWLGEVNLDSCLDVNSSPINASRDVRSRMGFNVQFKHKDKAHSQADASGRALPLAADKILPVGKRAAGVKNNDSDVAVSSTKKERESEYEKSNPATREPDYERYTQLREELKFELEELSEIPEEESLTEEDAFDLPIPSEENLMIRSDGYEEPWDLEAAQGEIEDQFNGVLVGEWILREMPTAPDKMAPTSTQACEPSSSSAAAPIVAPEGAVVAQPPPHELDVRTQKGYEKPWDWKPHMKDDRGPEGYEKPWDWKPHMKDDRPPKEYEEPWDKKAKNVGNEVIAAKIAKEAAKAGKDAASVGVPGQGKTTEDVRGQEGYDKPWDLKPHLKDGRPPNEYEEPWDTKAKDIETELIAAKIAKEAAKATAADGALERPVVRPAVAAGANAERIGLKRNVKDGRVHMENEALGNIKRTNQVIRTVSEDSGKPSRPAVLSPAQRHLRLSPKKKTVVTPDLESSPRNRIGERIQTRIPLEDQGWYHGTISRGDAEAILHGHKEGSYLVRHSESGTDEFSLSVKSSRGFMHMKIVVDRERKYILGQFSQPFVSIPQMIQYYTVSKLPIKGAEHMSLLYPVTHNVL